METTPDESPLYPVTLTMRQSRTVRGDAGVL